MISILKYNDQILKYNDQILSVSASTPTPCASCGWTYPSDWPSIYEEGDGKLVFLFRDVSTSFGISASTYWTIYNTCTVDWGDGSAQETLQGDGTVLYHSYAPGGGTPCSEGYTTYKCVITPNSDILQYFKFMTNGVNHYETQVPVLAAYSELDLTYFSLNNMFGNQVSTNVSGGVTCPYLKSVKFKDTANIQTTLVGYFLYGAIELEELVLPTINWENVLNADYFMQCPKLTFNIPTTFGAITSMINTFTCISDASELSFTGMSNVTGTFANNSTGVRKMSIDDATGITGFTINMNELEELSLPPTAPACTNFYLTNTSLTDLTVPSLSSAGASFNIFNNIKLKNITFTSTPTTGCQVYSNTALETANFDVLTTTAARLFRLSNNDSLLDVSINGLCSQLVIGVQSGDTYLNNVTRSILVNSTAGQFVQNCYVRYCNLDDTALNALFASLPTVTAKTIYIKGNPGIGVGGYDATIATSKGWTVNTTT